MCSLNTSDVGPFVYWDEWNPVVKDHSDHRISSLFVDGQSLQLVFFLGKYIRISCIPEEESESGKVLF